MRAPARSPPSISAGISAGASAVLRPGQRRLLHPREQRQYYRDARWADIGDPAANQGRTELMRYDSPTLHGFVLLGVDRRGRRLLGRDAAVRR